MTREKQTTKLEKKNTYYFNEEENGFEQRKKDDSTKIREQERFETILNSEIYI